MMSSLLWNVIKHIFSGQWGLKQLPLADLLQHPIVLNEL